MVSFSVIGALIAQQWKVATVASGINTSAATTGQRAVHTRPLYRFPIDGRLESGYTSLQTVDRSMKEPSEILQGTLDMLVLRALELGPMHGLGVSDRIKQVTEGVFVVRPGSLFPALQRLEQNGWIKGEWGESENHRRARFYTLTKAGQVQLGREKRNWHRAFSASTGYWSRSRSHGLGPSLRQHVPLLFRKDRWKRSWTRNCTPTWTCWWTATLPAG